MSIQELEAAVAKLPPEQLREFYAWMEAYVAEVVADVTKADDEQGKRPTAYELSKHLAGVFEGPGDLSTNPEYLDDLGESSLR